MNMVDCPRCDGSGRIDCSTWWCSDPSHEGECPRCDGSGEVPDRHSTTCDYLVRHRTCNCHLASVDSDSDVSKMDPKTDRPEESPPADRKV